LKAMLALTPNNAKSVLHASEGLDPGPGHTLRLHVNISRESLRERNNEPNRGEVGGKCAFLDIHQCCELLPLVIRHMQALGPAHQTFVQNFENLPYGSNITASRVNLPIVVQVRYSHGETRRIPANNFYLAAVKLEDRPHRLHVITFYPQLILD
jgi:hypothetical protein